MSLYEFCGWLKLHRLQAVKVSNMLNTNTVNASLEENAKATGMEGCFALDEEGRVIVRVSGKSNLKVNFAKKFSTTTLSNNFGKYGRFQTLQVT